MVITSSSPLAHFHSGAPWQEDNRLHLLRPWFNKEVMTARLTNISESAFQAQELVLFRWWHQLPKSTKVYGEGFQMLCQTGGTLAERLPIGRCDDALTYRLYDPNQERRLYNLCVLQHDDGFILLGFVSCRRFSGFFRLCDGFIEVVQDLEDLCLQPGNGIDLEGFTVFAGRCLDKLLNQFAALINQHHSRKLPKKIPQGWCSWYHYYADVTADDVEENLNQLVAWDALEYILLDDGYQAYMGDWLIPSAKFKAGVPSLIAKIRAAGKKAGIWIAPFIAQPESHLFRQHPDWFVKDHRGKPLAAESVTYGGWRCTPWYMLDGTHPEVKGYLTRVIQTMRNEWGVDYFKLDANFWGACHGGQYFRQNATRVEAYREGMAAINDAADGAFILGCNAPMWPSLGLVDGMRIADDIERQQHRFIQLRDEIFFRNWCHQRLWINDPDCLVLRNIPAQFASEANYRLHIATVVASGGILMLGDRLESLSERQKALVSRLSELLAKKFGAAKFTDFNNEIGIAENARGRLIAVTNPGAEHKHYSIPLEGNERAEVLIGNGLIKSDLIEIKLEGYDGVVIETVRN